MEVVKLVNRTHIHGNCSSFPSDDYQVEIRKEDMYISIGDADFDTLNSVLLEPKDAIKLAETILEYYKSRGI